MKLYDLDRSGNCYKVRLLLALLDQDYDTVTIDTRKGESLTPEFKALNPRGQIPVLDDGGTIIWDSMAIITYLARKFQRDDLLPDDALALGRVMQWLAVSENELLYGLARARAVKLFNAPFDYQACTELGHAGLATVEQQLTQTSWLAGQDFTLADIACYPYIALAHEGDVDISPYPAIQRWCRAIRALPGYVAMPGMETTPLD
jgi:glutathione S-transferase